MIFLNKIKLEEDFYEPHFFYENTNYFRRLSGAVVNIDNTNYFRWIFTSKNITHGYCLIDENKKHLLLFNLEDTLAKDVDAYIDSWIKQGFTFETKHNKTVIIKEEKVYY